LKKLNPLVTITGLRREVMKEVYRRIKRQEAQGIVMVGRFGEVYRQVYKEFKEKAEKLIKEGKIYLEEE